MKLDGRRRQGMPGRHDRAARRKWTRECVCVLALREKETDSGGLLSLQVSTIGLPESQQMLVPLLLANGLQSLI